MIVKAFVVLRAGHSGDDAQIAARCRRSSSGRSAPYKYPRAIEFVEALPQDRDRQAAALPPAPDRDRACRRAPFTERLVRLLQPPDWAAAEGLLQRGRRTGNARVRRRAGRLERPPGIRVRRLRGAGRGRRSQHRRRAARSGCGPGAHRPDDLVRRRSRRVRGEPACARRRLPGGHRSPLSCDDRGRGRRRWWSRAPASRSRRPRSCRTDRAAGA